MTRYLCIAAALALSACEEKSPTSSAPPAPTTSTQPAAPAPSAPAQTPTPAPATPATPAPAAADTVAALNLAFPVPANWKQVPPANSMRLAELLVPDASADPALACSVVFSTAGGTVQSNIDRWAGQVKDAAGQPVKAEVKAREVAGHKISTVELVGAYVGMGDAAPRPDTMLRGTIIETQGGLLFIKMTGPAAQMTAAGPAFDALLNGLTHK